MIQIRKKTKQTRSSGFLPVKVPTPPQPFSAKGYVLSHPTLTGRVLSNVLERAYSENTLNAMRTRLRKDGWRLPRLQKDRSKMRRKKSELEAFVRVHYSLGKTETARLASERFGRRIPPHTIDYVQQQLKAEMGRVPYRKSTHTGHFSELDSKTREPVTKSDQIRKKMVKDPRVSDKALTAQFKVSQVLVSRIRRQLFGATRIQPKRKKK